MDCSVVLKVHSGAEPARRDMNEKPFNFEPCRTDRDGDGDYDLRDLAGNVNDPAYLWPQPECWSDTFGKMRGPGTPWAE